MENLLQRKKLWLNQLEKRQLEQHYFCKMVASKKQNQRN